MKVYLWTIVVGLALAVLIKIFALATDDKKSVSFNFFDLTLFIGLFVWGLVVLITQS